MPEPGAEAIEEANEKARRALEDLQEGKGPVQRGRRIVRLPSPPDQEVEAITEIMKVLEELPVKAQARVLAYITLRVRGVSEESATVSGGSGGSTAPRVGEG